MKLQHACLCAALAIAGNASAQVINEPTLSTNAAVEIAQAALTLCRNEGQKVSVTVLDHAGRPKVAIRDDGAAPHTFEHSLRKGYTALTYNMPSARYGKRAAENPGAIGPQLLANITTAPGGLPIHSGKTLVGAIGVSGTPSSAGGGDHDAKCAQAGIERVFKPTAPH